MFMPTTILLFLAALCLVIRLLLWRVDSSRIRTRRTCRTVVRRSRPDPRTLVLREEDIWRYELRVDGVPVSPSDTWKGRASFNQP